MEVTMVWYIPAGGVASVRVGALADGPDLPELVSRGVILLHVVDDVCCSE